MTVLNTSTLSNSGRTQHQNKIDDFLQKNLPTPYLVIDLDEVKQQYLNLATLLPSAKIYYAVKANPAQPILRLLANLGSCFDIASIGELDQCLEINIPPDRISYGNTIKKTQDIAYAYNSGIRLFTFDSLEELQKIATVAPGSKVICRIFVDNCGAEWPLSKKFGCEVSTAHHLLLQSKELGLYPYGVAFHVGSQQCNPNQFDVAISQVAQLFVRLRLEGVELKMINLGGGFPAHYQSPILDTNSYTDVIKESLNRHFRNSIPEIMMEPGRSLVADAGTILTEVVLISKKSFQHEHLSWVFVDIGKFGGLIETMDECIRYRIVAPKYNGCTEKVVIAGPTCDSVDVLYEKNHYELRTYATGTGDRYIIVFVY
ncbi:type III PLP-dependent enzyme [Chrysosporum bergii ANA360D]|uniref:ornithine decarboxylase n=1 Tax=Chrysosporum bergii ANA360D TaxID=617107 RepID=A0AA43GQ37_9CYAN|nr:type III PLP-dependent enzyme [Chrysosporum bergii]MDH6059708.1 type III PLP-dependent enzyme [Chrysosporum bergii ANA360D]